MEYSELPQIHVMFNTIIFYNDGTTGVITNVDKYKIPKRLDFKQMETLQTYRPDLAFNTLFFYRARDSLNKKTEKHPLLKYSKNKALDYWFKVS